MNWKIILNDDPLPWLLEDDPVNPGIRYFALRDLMGLLTDSAEVIAAQKAVMTTGPVLAILAQQRPDGYWIKPGYLPKYNGTMWSLIFLAQLGADGHDPCIRQACEHLFWISHWLRHRFLAKPGGADGFGLWGGSAPDQWVGTAAE